MHLTNGLLILYKQKGKRLVRIQRQKCGWLLSLAAQRQGHIIRLETNCFGQISSDYHLGAEIHVYVHVFA